MLISGTSKKSVLFGGDLVSSSEYCDTHHHVQGDIELFELAGTFRNASKHWCFFCKIKDSTKERNYSLLPVIVYEGFLSALILSWCLDSVPYQNKASEDSTPLSFGSFGNPDAGVVATGLLSNHRFFDMQKLCHAASQLTSGIHNQLPCQGTVVTARHECRRTKAIHSFALWQDFAWPKHTTLQGRH